MKKLILITAALLVLAGSTFQVAQVDATQIAGTTKPKPKGGPTTDSAPIPPPTCPPSDPNGCGIYDGL